MSGWKTFKYTAPAPLRCPSWFEYEKLSSKSFITGTTPDAAPSIPLIGAPASRRFDRLIPTPPPIRDNCKAELIARPIEFMLSVTSNKKHETNSPRRFLPAFKYVGVAGW